eukprot:12168454-Alexandrium_andersonii.AAC.1
MGGWAVTGARLPQAGAGGELQWLARTGGTMDPHAVATEATRALGEEVSASLVHARDPDANASVPM